jgi:hypothetical protein
VLLKDDKVVKAACSDCPRFLNSLLVDEGSLEAGTYQILIDPIFNESVDRDPSFRKVNVDVYSPHEIVLEVAGEEVMETFERAVLANARESDEK